jgi:hypothetical protein
MGLFRVDQSKSKQYCLDLLDQLQADQDHPRFSDAARMVLEKIMKEAEGWHVDTQKLKRLLTSMLLSGNIRGATKIISGAVPDVRTQKWVPIAGLALLSAAAWYLRRL